MSPRLAALTWPVSTARLTLRPATPADVDATWGFRRLPEVQEWMSGGARTRGEYAARFVEPRRLGKTLLVEHDGVVVGDLMLAVEDAWAQREVADRARGVLAEVGWCLDPSYAGRGLATEAARELLRICFEDLGLRRVVANAFAANEASWRLMERIGMRRELHAVRDSLHRSGEWLDNLGYAVLADEWRGRAGR